MNFLGLLHISETEKVINQKGLFDAINEIRISDLSSDSSYIQAVAHELHSPMIEQSILHSSVEEVTSSPL